MRGLQRPLFYLALALAVGSDAMGGDAVRVTARVVPFFVAQVEEPESAVTITDEDIKVGYADIEGQVIDVRSNDSAGYAVVLHFDRAFVERVDVSGLQEPITVSGPATFAVQRLERIGNVRSRLRYRLHLSNDCQAGPYPLPIRVTLHRLGL